VGNHGVVLMLAVLIEWIEIVAEILKDLSNKSSKGLSWIDQGFISKCKLIQMDW
jgi:hypothetical protein